MKRIALTLALATLTILASCKKADNGEVTLVLDWTPNTNHTGLFVALDKGFYKNEGLAVKIVEPPEESTTALVASGKAPFGISFQDTLSNALCGSSPLPVTAIAAILQHNTSGVVSLKTANITRPRDLEGHTFSCWQTPIEIATLRALVEKDGGDFSRVNILPTSVYDVVQGLGNLTDAMSVYYAWDGVAATVAGLDVNWFSFASIDTTQDFYTPVIIASNEYLKKNPERTKAFLRATALGYKWASLHTEEAAAILIKHSPELSRELVSKSQAWITAQYFDEKGAWGSIDAGRWSRYYEWLNDNKILPAPLDPKIGFSTEYLPK